MDHQATHAKFFATDEAAVVLADSPLNEHDDAIDFSPTKSRHWRLELTPGPSKTIVVRGIRFLHEGKEIYPRMAPYGPLKSIP